MANFDPYESYGGGYNAHFMYFYMINTTSHSKYLGMKVQGNEEVVFIYDFTKGVRFLMWNCLQITKQGLEHRICIVDKDCTKGTVESVVLNTLISGDNLLWFSEVYEQDTSTEAMQTVLQAFIDKFTKQEAQFVEKLITASQDTLVKNDGRNTLAEYVHSII